MFSKSIEPARIAVRTVLATPLSAVASSMRRALSFTRRLFQMARNTAEFPALGTPGAAAMALLPRWLARAATADERWFVVFGPCPSPSSNPRSAGSPCQPGSGRKTHKQQRCGVLAGRSAGVRSIRFGTSVTDFRRRDGMRGIGAARCPGAESHVSIAGSRSAE